MFKNLRNSRYRWLLSGTHFECCTDLIGCQVVDDEFDDFIEVVVDKVLALVVDGRRQVRAKSLENIPVTIKSLTIFFGFCPNSGYVN